MRSKIILIMLAACGLCSVLAMAQSAWIQSVKTDALTNISHVRFALRGKFLQAPQRSDLTSPVFVLDCAPHKTTYQGRVHGKILDAVIVTGAVIDSANNFDMDAAFMGHPDPTRVLVRFRRDDEKKVQETEWAHTKDFASLYLSGAGGVSIEVNNVLYGHALTHKEERATKCTSWSSVCPSSWAATWSWNLIFLVSTQSMTPAVWSSTLSS